MDVSFDVAAPDEQSLAEIVTPEYIMKNVSDDWGEPIQNVTIIKADPA